MNKRVCYAPQKGVDDVIASKMGPTFNPYRVATLRGMYESRTGTALDTSNAPKAAFTLSKFRNQIMKENSAAMKSIGTNLEPGYKTLKRTFTAEERFNRTSMISTMFSAVIDSLQKDNPNLSRKDAVEGYTDADGVRQLGEFSIFEKVYNQILQLEATFRAKGDIDKADKFRQVLENWPALATFTRMRLRDTEGIKLGNELEFADETTELNYGDNNLAELFSAEEAPREHWTTTTGMESSFGKIGKMVRRALSSLYVPEIYYETDADGRKVQKVRAKRDDLGFVIAPDPVKTHQALMNAFRGVTTVAQMMAALKNVRTGQAKETWMIPILDMLMSNPQLRTQFFVDFKKNFQPYGILVEDKANSKGGLKRWKTKLLNKTEDLLKGSFLSRISLGMYLNPETSVFDVNGKVRADNLNKVIESVKEWLYEPESNSSSGDIFSQQKKYGKGESKFFSKGGSYVERREFLLDTLEAFGVDIDIEALDRIMSNKRDLGKLTDALHDLVKFGITSNQLKRLANGEIISYMEMFKRKQAGKKEGPFQEKIRKIHEIITKNREGLRLESRARHKDSKGNNITLYSDILPSYMGDMFDKIKSYVDADDKGNLRLYLTKKYLSSPFFKRDGVILNKWLEELLRCCDSEEPLADTFAAEFNYLRFLGTSDMSFENFTSKQHMIDMLTEFSSDREISPGKDTALYPVFVLGDSGVSKYIRAKRYDRGTIIDGFYNVYRQEIERQKLAKATNEWLQNGDINGTGKSFKLIENFSNSGDRFSTLLFLNEDYKASDGTVGKYFKMLSKDPTEAEVKAAIEEFLKDSLVDFKKSLEKLGLLETKEVTEFDKDGKPIKVERYVYLGRDVTPSTLDGYLADFYMNVKFATIQQLQLMTIDPSFYKDVKDLQKRYKEIHAPGIVLDIQAKDKKGNRYSEDGIERCAYFDDVEVNAEDSNSEFMEVIAAIHGKDSAIYKKYKRNTLTDGQGYRSLRSYRKVMGMAGQWTEAMEEAFQRIEQIRADFGYDKDGNHVEIPAERLAEISKLAVVFQPIKPYMFTHEKIALNANTQVHIPVQHKYAEAVLIPELLPAGSKLRDMAYWMDENDVDLIASTKAVKVGIFGSTDISKVTDAKSLRESLANAYVHQLSYSDYRIQTNVPEHINSSQLFGTQVRKLIMAGILMDDYHYQSYIDSPDGMVNLGGNHGKVRLNGRNLVSFYNSLIVANILDSFDKFSKGVSSADALSSKLIQGIINNSRESMDNILAYAIADGNFAMPLFEGSLEHDTAALILSMFKKIVNKQSIKGGSAVQVSAMGISGYKEDKSLRFVTDGKGNILYAECEVPFDISYTDEDGNVVHLDFDTYCNNDGTLKMSADGKTSLLEAEFPGSTSILAYRIPTERDYSMMNLRVVRFSRKIAGGTIKVPAEATTIAGFDFDIDKLYFMLKEFVAVPIEKRYSQSERNEIFANIYKKRPDIENALRMAREKSGRTERPLHSFWDAMFALYPSYVDDPSYNKNKLFKESAKELGIKPTAVKEGLIFEEYDYDKPPMSYESTDALGNKVEVEGNSRAVRNNMLIHLIQQRLMDPETLEQRTTPGGFANASVAAKTMRFLLYGETSDLIKDGRVDFDALNRKVKDESIPDPEPSYDPSDPMTIITYNQQNQVAGKLIGIFANQNTNHAFSSLMHTFRLRKAIEFAGHSYGDGRFSDFLHAPTGVNVDLNVAEFLAASVDAVKDPVLNFLNLNTITADSGAILARLGYTTTEIGMLFNQPIIRIVCEYCFNNDVPFETAVRDIKAFYKDKGVNISPTREQLNPAMFTLDKLALNILRDNELQKTGENAMDNPDYAFNQLEVLRLFNEIYTVAKEVSGFITSTKFTASNAVGSTFGDLYAQQMKVRQYLSTVNSKNSRIEMRVTDAINLPVWDGSDLLSMSNREYLDAVIATPFAYEQAMFDANRRVLIAMSKYFPYEKKAYSSARARLASVTKTSTLDAETINSIHNDMLVYLLASQEVSEFNGDLPKEGTPYGDITVREYYTEHFAEDLLVHLHNYPELRDKAIFKYMIPVMDEESNEVSITVQGIGGLAPYMKDEIKESWAELAKDPEMSRLATDLFMYNFFKLGFGFSHATFMSLAPIEVKQNIQVPNFDGSPRSYVEFMNDIMADKFNIDADNFARQYMLNHLDNKAFGINSRSRNVNNILRPLILRANLAASSFTLDLSAANISDENAKNFLVSEDTRANTRVFTPIIRFNTEQGEVIYMADSFDETRSCKMTYRKVEKLGTKGLSLQYHGESFMPSVVRDRNSEDSFERGSTNIPGESERPTEGFNKKAAIEVVANMAQKIMLRELMLGPDGNPPSVEELREVYDKQASDVELSEMVKTIREAVNNEGCLTMDETGKIVKIC